MSNTQACKTYEALFGVSNSIFLGIGDKISQRYSAPQRLDLGSSLLSSLVPLKSLPSQIDILRCNSPSDHVSSVTHQSSIINVIDCRGMQDLMYCEPCMRVCLSGFLHLGLFYSTPRLERYDPSLLINHGKVHVLRCDLGR